ncbi:MAG: MerR family transcriptional regulator [Candidatus Cloacimonetes bacterium HGW-Cloacimonetes-1]|jgi:DNA-binding transcriptional MerR regulator|nr:MAG: MerR family transcriptional regulator [Candidatus Cloacimonetes bacterium HGW-Cloacimonetes-1]
MTKYYYTIGEVSNLIDIKPYVIRYWETEFHQLRPRKSKGRIRKYDEEQILLLKKIKDMLYTQRFTIEGARQKLKAEKSSGKPAEPISITAAPPIEKQANLELTNPLHQHTLQEIRESLEQIRIKCNNFLRSNK